MIIELDDFAIGQGTNFLITEIGGLGKPKIRTSSVNNSGSDGGDIGAQNYEMRQITVVGLVKSTSQTAHVTDRRNFNEAAPIRSQTRVYITLFDGSQYYTDCYIQDLDMGYKTFGVASEYKLELLAPDPLFYGVSGVDNSVSLTHVQSGGYVFPYELPVEWADGSSPTSITNFGDSTVYPVITLTGTAINPVIYNQTTGELVKVNITTISGDELIIDLKNHTVTLNGGNILANLDSQSTWWGLVPGPNNLLLDTDSDSDTGTALVEWNDGYLTL